MSEESPSERKSSGVSSDLLLKLLPYAILVASYVFGFGKRDTNIDVVSQQLAEQRQVINSLSERVGNLSDRISKIEGSQDSLRRDLEQNQVYRDKR